MSDYKPRVLVDFDGVVHAYSRGWADGTAYDGPMPGARDALAGMERAGYEVVIFSTRDASQIAEWLARHDFPAGLTITNEKLPAVALIDDRAIRFVDWTGAMLELIDRYPARKP